ncbi:SRPBCC family protein [Neobacillus novalis]|uniref:SRPBCC family protein n=1 Tax=Neobacillus novalis TaxID=220687 RepID=A0AA95SC73_9BACI|nr:SRPBCC family protein [Neobacillus novalis]WHY85828.1 SRPBCC family protein [Neobacillus novalis]
MPSGVHQVEVGLPINKVWDFVKDMDNWAPLIPGYIQHRKFSNRQSTWEFYSNIGFIKKKISLMVTIKEWIEPTRVTFHLKGLNEELSGGGYFLAEAIDKNKTGITGFIEITAGGAMGPFVNTVLKSNLPKVTKEMAIAISTKLEELNRI